VQSLTWDQREHWNDVLHKHENLVTVTEVAVITTCMQEELATGIKGILRSDRCIFQERRVVTSLVWPIEKKVEWLDTVSEVIAAYIAKYYCLQKKLYSTRAREKKNTLHNVLW
jgi:hypothetical protein